MAMCKTVKVFIESTFKDMNAERDVLTSFCLGSWDPAMDTNADALSRVVQGIIQGVMAGISFIGAEYFDQFLFPGGNSYIARRALKKMIPATKQYL